MTKGRKIFLLCLLLTSIILLIIAFNIKDKYSQYTKIDAIVTDSYCYNNNCKITFAYLVNSRRYDKNLTVKDNISKGDTIYIFYNKKYNDEVLYYYDYMKTFKILIIISIILFFILIIFYFI